MTDVQLDLENTKKLDRNKTMTELDRNKTMTEDKSQEKKIQLNQKYAQDLGKSLSY